MLSDKLDNLMVALKISSVDIAGAAGFDRSNVSRLRSGSRQIPKESSAAKKLVDGILIYSEKNSLTPGLCSIIEVEENSDSGSIREALNEYLFTDEFISEKKSVRKNKEQSLNTGEQSRNFGKKLDLIMNMTGLINVNLSRILHVDASLISRYRKGLLSPRSNQTLSISLSDALWTAVTKNGKTDELAHIMSFPPKSLNKEFFYDWLFDVNSGESTDSDIIKKLLSKFDAFSETIVMPLPSFTEAAPDAMLNSSYSEYRGYEGLREAVIRFLGNIIQKEKAPKELYLYSDQNMDWMTEDSEFLKKWAALMSIIVKRNTKIKIIHNIERNLSEMSSAIISWLPLYMSGMVESYYCIKPGGERFSHTLFLCPDEFCIEGSHVIGMEKSGIYRFRKEKEHLAFFKESFSRLMKNTRPLVHFSSAYPSKISPNTVYKEYPELPFRNMKVWVSKEAVRISHSASPDAAMIFTHPLMCRAFNSYIKEL